MIEREKEPRFKLRINAKYKILDVKEYFEVSKMRNFSLEGICFESEKSLGENVCISLELDLEDGKAPITLVGEMVWSRAESPIDFQVTKYDIKDSETGPKFINGVRVVNIPENDLGRFLKYYCDRIVQILSDCLEM